MVKLLILSNIFETSTYIVGEGERLIDIALTCGVPPSCIIQDNALTSEVKCNQMLIIKKRGKIKILQPNDIVLDDFQLIKQKTIANTPYLYPFQVVLDI